LARLRQPPRTCRQSARQSAVRDPQSAIRKPQSASRSPQSAMPLPLFDDDTVSGALREALPIRFSLESTPNHTVEQVRAKERAFAQLTGDQSALSRWKRVAHAWCAAWLAPSGASVPAAAFGPLSDAALTG